MLSQYGGSAYQSQLQKLITLQNKAIKLIGGGYPRKKVTPFYSQLKVLKLPDLFKLEVGKLVHAHFQNKLPNNLSNIFFLLKTYLRKLSGLRILIFCISPDIAQIDYRDATSTRESKYGTRFLLKSNQPPSILLNTNLKIIYSKTIDSTQPKIYLPNFPCRIPSSYNIILVLLFH